MKMLHKHKLLKSKYVTSQTKSHFATNIYWINGNLDANWIDMSLQSVLQAI